MGVINRGGLSDFRTRIRNNLLGNVSAPAVASIPFRGIYASHSIHSTRSTSNSRKSQGSILTPLTHPVLQQIIGAHTPRRSVYDINLTR